MSFSDNIFRKENIAFKKSFKFRTPWSKRSNSSFFRGSLSDCEKAREYFNGDIRFCSRAKVVYEANRSKNPFLKDVATTSNFKDSGLKVSCRECQKETLAGEDFVKNLYSHK